MYKKTIALIMMFSLASCATRQESGGVIGMFSGGGVGYFLTGGSPKGMMIGSLLGGIAGLAIGKQLDENDKKMMAQTTYDVLEKAKTDTITKWDNPDSGNRGNIKPTKTYQAPDGRYCREFIQEVSIGGKAHSVYGTACRQLDGQWKIIESHG